MLRDVCTKLNIIGIMAKVLSFMATHTGDRSQYVRSVAEIDDQLSNNEENKRFAGTPFKRCDPQTCHREGAGIPAGIPCKRCEP